MFLSVFFLLFHAWSAEGFLANQATGN